MLVDESSYDTFLGDGAEFIENFLGGLEARERGLGRRSVWRDRRGGFDLEVRIVLGEKTNKKTKKTHPTTHAFVSPPHR